MITIGIPMTLYSTSKSWEPFMRYIFQPHNLDFDVIDLDPDYNRNKLPKNVDLVLFDGGADVHPMLYGGIPHESISVNVERDWNEKIIFDFYKNLPTVFAGICRGAQFLNVMMGGNLYEDLPSVNLGHDPKHDVTLIDSECMLMYLKKERGDEIAVNSLHHQAVKDLGDDLIPTMVDSNFGVIEGYHSLDGKIRAVQSHPEINASFYTERISICDWLFRVKEF